jgi:hypothetical protein
VSDISIYVQLLACGSLVLLALSGASATAQHLRSKKVQTVRVTVRQPANR